MKKFCMGCMEQYEETLDVCPYCGYSGAGETDELLHIEPGEILQERYLVGRTIGSGGFGITYIGWDALLEHKVAIKEYMPSEFSTRALGTKEVTVYGGKSEEQFRSGLEKFHEEAKRLAQFSSDDGIVHVYDSFQENNTAYIVMELMEGETLAAYLEREKRIPYDKAIQMMQPVMNALCIVHAAGVIHRDISPDNIFMTKDGGVKLIDFGAARFATTSHSRSLSVLIKPGYSPEEQYRSRGDQGTYTDVYALGAVLYRMITGEVPPDALERRAYYERKKKDILTPISKYVRDIPEDVENAIYNAMNVRIEDRTQTMQEFSDELTGNKPVARRKGTIRQIDFLRWPLWAKIVFPSAAAALVVMFVLMLSGIFIPDRSPIPLPNMPRVPAMIGDTLTDADRTLTDLTLRYQVTGKQYSSDIAADLVLTQSINAGAFVKKNTLIGIVVSGGEETEYVPDIIGESVENAAKALRDLGFEVTTEEIYSDTIAEGGVISQSVEPGNAAAVGSEIHLVVSKGLDPALEHERVMVEVPDFTGKTLEEATQLALQSKLLLLTKERLYSDTFAKDTIMLQDPKAGDSVLSSSTVNLTISLGAEMVRMPDITYYTEDEAKEMLDKVKLTYDIQYAASDTVQAGLVMSQSQKAGVELKPGTKIVMTVSTGSDETADASAAEDAPAQTPEPAAQQPDAAAQQVSVSLNKTSLSMHAGENGTLSASVSPAGQVDWTSSDSSIVSVSGGNVEARGVGTAVITAKAKNGNASAQCTVTVEASSYLTYKSMDIPVGHSVDISALLTGSAENDPGLRGWSVTWSVSGDSAAIDTTANANALHVNAKAPGTATVTAHCTAGSAGWDVTCAVNVHQDWYAVLDTNERPMVVGETYRIGVTEAGSNDIILTSWDGTVSKTTEEHIWWSFDDSVATVDGSGNVTALSSGNTLILYGVPDQVHRDKGVSCAVTVTPEISEPARISIESREVSLAELEAAGYLVPVLVQIDPNPGVNVLEFGVQCDAEYEIVTKDRIARDYGSLPTASADAANGLDVEMLAKASSVEAGLAWCTFASYESDPDNHNFLMLVVHVPADVQPGEVIPITYRSTGAGGLTPEVFQVKQNGTVLDYVANGALETVDGFIRILD